MADEDITLDGQPLQSLRVADLKAALERRNLPKNGQKNTLIKRLKGALMLENLQKSSSSHSGLQPNSQIGEEMSQNSFIKQYLAKQQELLRQRLEKEAQQEEGADAPNAKDTVIDKPVNIEEHLERPKTELTGNFGFKFSIFDRPPPSGGSPAVPEEDEDQSEDNDNSSFVSDKRCPLPSQLPLIRKDEKLGGGSMVGHGMMARRSDAGDVPTLRHQESPEAPGSRIPRATFHQGHKEPPAPSPPRAVASLSVRVLGQPDLQGLPPAVPRAQEKEGVAPSEPGSAHPVLHLSRSARVSAGKPAQDDSDDDDDDDDSEDDEEWGPGPGPGPGGVRKGNRVPPQPVQMPIVIPSAARSKRKLQPPQHIPPPQAHQTPMQLRHPTPPPSPPPDLFPLPDTPKQSPQDTDDKEGESSESARGARASVPPSTLQRQISDSSSRSSSPEPSAKRRPGPLSLLVHKMESEEADVGERAHSSAESITSVGPAGSKKSLLQKMDKKGQQENREIEEEKRPKKEGEKENESQHQKEKIEIRKEKREEELDKRKQTADKNHMAVTKAKDSGSSSDSDSKSDSSSCSSRSSSPTRDKSWPASQLKKDQGQGVDEEKKTDLRKATEKGYLSKRSVVDYSD